MGLGFRAEVLNVLEAKGVKGSGCHFSGRDRGFTQENHLLSEGGDPCKGPEGFRWGRATQGT